MPSMPYAIYAINNSSWHSDTYPGGENINSQGPRDTEPGSASLDQVRAPLRHVREEDCKNTTHPKQSGLL